MLTDHKVKSLTLILENAMNTTSVSVTTTDDATYTETATAVESTIDIDGLAIPASQLDELKVIGNSLVATHESLVGITHDPDPTPDP